MLSNEARLVEVIMFIENEPLEVEKISELTGLSERSVLDALEELSDDYKDRGSGLMLNVDEGDVYSFLPSSDLYSILKSSYGKKVDRRLSKAAMETLAIVAYSQPITRGEISDIRGVNSDTIVKLLRDKEYIMIRGRKDTKGHPCLYYTTRKFLYEFGIDSIEELPKLSEVDRIRFEKGVGEEPVPEE